MTLTVFISKGYEGYPMYRLLECLTRTGLLDNRVVWSERLGQITIRIEEATTEEVKVFSAVGQYEVTTN